MEKQDVDVIIIGAGPAGAACALALRHYAGASVLVLDNSDLQQVRVGEHVSASIFDFLDYLKVDKNQMPADCFTANYGNISYWGSDQANFHDSLFTTAGSSYQLQRDEFDLALLKELADAGGHVLPRSRHLHVEQDEQDNWHVSFEQASRGAMKIKSRYLVDASGRKAKISQKLGIGRKKADHLMAVGAYLHFDDRTLSQQQLIETTKLGWWYSATLSNNTLVTTFFSDMDIIRQQQLNKPENWNSALSQTRHMSKYLQGGKTTSSMLWLKCASSQISENYTHSNFIAIGDAAASFDPISSMGLGFALSSACHAAKAIKRSLMNNNCDSLDTYKNDIKSNFAQYQVTKQQVYRQEQRWKNEAFWQRRQDNISIS